MSFVSDDLRDNQEKSDILCYSSDTIQDLQHKSE